MNKLFFYFIILFSFFCCTSRHKQIELNENPNNIGIKISYDSFEYVFNGICAKLKKNKILEIDEMINVVRIVNTINTRNRENKCIPLIYAYYIQKSDLIKSELGVKKISDGYYSEKYDLFLYDTSHNNSRFCIIMK